MRGRCDCFDLRARRATKVMMVFYTWALGVRPRSMQVLGSLCHNCDRHGSASIGYEAYPLRGPCAYFHLFPLSSLTSVRFAERKSIARAFRNVTVCRIDLEVFSSCSRLPSSSPRVPSTRCRKSPRLVAGSCVCCGFGVWG